MSSNTVYVNIDDTDGKYFFTAAQSEKLRRRFFTDDGIGSILSGSTTASGLLARPPNRISTEDLRSQTYLSSGTIDIRRYGVEITDIKHWTAGTVKISAGTPGHIVSPVCYGADNVSIIDPDVYFDIPKFDPISFIESQLGDLESFLRSYTFPIITSDRNLLDNYNYNGIIEPLSIRPIMSFSSVDAPFESHDVRGTMMAGNETRKSADQVLTVDQYEIRYDKPVFFLDAAEEMLAMSGSIANGTSIHYFSMGSNSLSPWDDNVKPRGVSISSTYGTDMISALTALSQSTSFYVSEKERSATSGFVYDNSNPQGTDSIAFGGMLY